MIAHGRFEGNLHLQVPGKVFGESGQSIYEIENLHRVQYDFVGCNICGMPVLVAIHVGETLIFSVEYKSWSVQGTNLNLGI